MISTLLAFLVPTAYAAAEPALVNAAGSIATATQDNVIGVISNATLITTMGVLLAVVIGVGLLFKFLKRSAK
jgi:hypothetical protein